MKISVDLRHLCDGNILWEQGIKPLVQSLTRYPTFRPEIRHLIQGMNPGIRSAGGREDHLFVDKPANLLLHYPLYRPGIRLVLPTVVVGTVIFYCKLNIAHRLFGYPYDSSIRNP